MVYEISHVLTMLYQRENRYMLFSSVFTQKLHVNDCWISLWSNEKRVRKRRNHNGITK